jgi:hypothetical protein
VTRRYAAACHLRIVAELWGFGTHEGNRPLPSLMVHYGTTLLAGWPVRHQSVTTALLLGATWPDVPWMALRVLDLWSPDELRIPLRLYAQAFHTPLMCLWGGLIFACFMQRPRPQALAFIGAAWFHLVLDAFQTRYGNGVALLYPFSWRVYDFELFWPDGTIGLILLAMSTAVVLHAFWKGLEPLHLRRPSWLRVTALTLGYLLMPLATWHAAFDANVFNALFIYFPSALEGKEVGFERNALVSSKPPRLRTWYDHHLALDQVPDEARPGDVVSLRGTYGEGQLKVRQFHIHSLDLHSTPSIVAFVMLVLAFWRAQANAPRRLWANLRTEPWK